MYIYSGACRECKIGIPVNQKDMNGKDLFTGDIVHLFIINEVCQYISGDMSAIIIKQYRNIAGQNPILLPESQWSKPFAMGIRSECDETEIWQDNERWAICKIKNWSDVIEGEHWKDWGFRYSNN